MLPAARSTRLIALLGDPVAHSLSPLFQNAAFQAAGVDGVYLALRTDTRLLPGLLRGIALAGGGGNVTLPHKRFAATLVDEPSEAVRRTGACNTFWSADDRVIGDNTDVAGVGTAVRSLLDTEPQGARVLVLGAGGAARAAVVALAQGGAARIDVANRTPSAATALARDLGTGGHRVFALDELPRGERIPSYDLVVNATSLGLRDEDPDPLPAHSIPAATAVLDLVYRRGGTPWVNRLRDRGIRAEDGTELLIQQGAASFQHWWEIPAPLETMRAALAR